MWLAQKRLGPTRRAEKNSHTEATKMDIYGASWFISPYGYGSIPINTIFRGLFTSINPSYFDVNRRGTRF